mmetsp:Transcript_16257/g.26458  ORF Transcript_16257/g.26458 Transcript_16257/m.26458 type:complete len:87 (+) Transcript_16257:1640-1900(+)
MGRRLLGILDLGLAKWDGYWPLQGIMHSFLISQWMATVSIAYNSVVIFLRMRLSIVLLNHGRAQWFGSPLKLLCYSFEHFYDRRLL